MRPLNLAAELLLWVIILMPLLYVLFAWEQLPDRIPVHFNLQGEPNNWAGKSELTAIILFLSVGVNLLFLFIPALDPKGKIQKMGSHYDKLRIVTMLFITLFSGLLIFNATSVIEISPNLILLLVGLFLAALGNYLQVVKPNYFIGIRTPWTLESETVWRKTHRLASPIWVIGGLLIVLLPFFTDGVVTEVTLLGIFLIIGLVPVIYSYFCFKKEKKAQQT